LLPRITGLFFSPDSGQSSEEERNKALAATIAVTVAMSRGHLPEGAGLLLEGTPLSQSSPTTGEEVREGLDSGFRRNDGGVRGEEGDYR